MAGPRFTASWYTSVFFFSFSPMGWLLFLDICGIRDAGLPTLQIDSGWSKLIYWTNILPLSVIPSLISPSNDRNSDNTFEPDHFLFSSIMEWRSGKYWQKVELDYWESYLNVVHASADFHKFDLCKFMQSISRSESRPEFCQFAILFYYIRYFRRKFRWKPFINLNSKRLVID